MTRTAEMRGEWASRAAVRIGEVDSTQNVARTLADAGAPEGTVVWADPDREMVCVLFTTQPSDATQGALLRRCSNLVAASAI